MQKIEMPNFLMNPSGGLEQFRDAVETITEGGEPVAIMNSEQSAGQPIFWMKLANAKHKPIETYDLSKARFNVLASLMTGLNPNGIAYRANQQSDNVVMLIPTKSALKLTH